MSGYTSVRCMHCWNAVCSKYILDRENGLEQRLGNGSIAGCKTLIYMLDH
jgi:hypothetical protein